MRRGLGGEVRVAVERDQRDHNELRALHTWKRQRPRAYLHIRSLIHSRILTHTLANTLAHIHSRIYTRAPLGAIFEVDKHAPARLALPDSITPCSGSTVRFGTSTSNAGTTAGKASGAVSSNHTGR